jgi:hypothetical protein
MKYLLIFFLNIIFIGCGSENKVESKADDFSKASVLLKQPLVDDTDMFIDKNLKSLIVDKNVSALSDAKNVSSLSSDKNNPGSQISNLVIHIIIGSPVIRAVYKNPFGIYRSSLNGEYSVRKKGYPVMVYKNAIIDNNFNGFPESTDELLLVKMFADKGNIISPFTTILHMGVSEELLSNVLGYKADFYQNYLENDDIILTKMAIILLQVLVEIENEEIGIDKFINFLTSYKRNKDLNVEDNLEVLFYKMYSSLFVLNTSKEVVSYLIYGQFERAVDIDEGVVLYRKFDNDISKLHEFSVLDKGHFKYTDVEDFNFISDIDNKNTFADISEEVLYTYYKGFALEFSSLTDDVNTTWTINYSSDCINYNFFASSVTQNSSLTKELYFHKSYRNRDNRSICFQYKKDDDINIEIQFK